MAGSQATLNTIQSWPHEICRARRPIHAYAPLAARGEGPKMLHTQAYTRGGTCQIIQLGLGTRPTSTHKTCHTFVYVNICMYSFFEMVIFIYAYTCVHLHYIRVELCFLLVMEKPAGAHLNIATLPRAQHASEAWHMCVHICVYIDSFALDGLYMGRGETSRPRC